MTLSNLSKTPKSSSSTVCQVLRSESLVEEKMWNKTGSENFAKFSGCFVILPILLFQPSIQHYGMKPSKGMSWKSLKDNLKLFLASGKF